MNTTLANFWHKISHIGINPDSNSPDKRYVVIGNQVVISLSVTLSFFSLVMLLMGIYRGALLLALMVTTFVALTYLIYRGWYVTGRVLGITLQNVNIVILAIFLGYQTRVIDFLIFAALMPLVLFSMRQKLLIGFCIWQNFIFYIFYHLFEPQMLSMGLPPHQQFVIYSLSIPIKFVTILLVVFVLIRYKTEQEKKMKEVITELETVNAGLKQFAYVTSHDLKTPLRNISTYLQLLRRRNTLDSESNEMIENAVKSVKHLNQLITDIFMYATTDFKTEMGEQLDMNLLMNDVRSDIKAIIQEKKVVLIIPGDLPQINVNRTQAMHVFSNLIGNAIKYNKSEIPKVELSFKQEGKFIEFTITDNGIGIDEKYREQIFEIFKRLHTQEEYEGTGIGLAICKKIVESYGGRIRMKSEVGQGSKFIFTLPH